MTLHRSVQADQSGVWGHSSPAGLRRYVILCVGQQPGIAHSFRFWATVRGIRFVETPAHYPDLLR